MNSSVAVWDDGLINMTLPDELFVQIFKDVGIDDQFRLRGTCSVWRDIMDHMIGVDLHLGRPDPSIWGEYKGVPFQRDEAIPAYGVKRCFVSRLERRQALAQLQDRNLEWKAPGLFHYLWIDGFLSPDTFNQLTRNLDRLRSLELHFSTLASFPLTTVQNVNFADLVSLENFSVRMFTVGEPHFSSIGAGLNNGITLLNSDGFKFLRLRELYLSFPLETQFNWPLSRAICSCLRRHAGSLRALDLGYSRAAESNQAFLGEALPGLSAEDAAAMNLESVRVACLIPGHPSMTIFQDLINGQGRLRSLNSFFHRLSPADALRPLSTSFETLVNVQLSLRSRRQGGPIGHGPPFDVTPIGRCLNLEVLELYAEESMTGFHDAQVILQPDLVNLQCLPGSLRVLTLSNLLVGSVDAVGLTRDKPDLDKFQLFNAGVTGTLGLTFDGFLQILADLKITQLSISNSINRDSITEAGHSQDQAVRLAAIVLQQNTFPVETIFSAHLIDGRYVPGLLPTPAAPTGDFPDGSRTPLASGVSGDFVIDDLDEVDLDMSEGEEDEEEHPEEADEEDEAEDSDDDGSLYDPDDDEA